MTTGPFTAVVRAAPDALGEHVRAWLLDAARAAPGAPIGLAVGGSTLPLYGALPPDPVLTAARILPLDELVPAPADPNAAFVARLRAAMPAALRARVEPLPPDPEALDALVDETGLGAVVLGLGPDGHIAFNQPGSGPETTARVVTLTEDNRTRLGEVAPATRALTLGVAQILAARRVALVAAGAGKADALARVLEGPEGADVPASLLRRHPAATVFVAVPA